MIEFKKSMAAFALVVTTFAAPLSAFAEELNFGILGAIFAPKALAPNEEQKAAEAEPVVETKGNAKPAKLRVAGGSKPFADLIAKHAADNKVPARLAEAIVQIESRFQPHVRNGGALGLMQIKPQTARGVGFSGPANELLNPDTNLRFGIRYLAVAYRMARGDTCATVMRYQSGIGTTHMSAANRAYCAKAKAIMG